MSCTVDEGWYYLGPAAANYRYSCEGIIVKQIHDDILVDIQDWECVWTNAKTMDKGDYSLWRGIPPTLDYVVLGSFLVRGVEKPTKQDTMGMKAVRKEVVIEAKASREIWSNTRHWLATEGAVWDIKADHDSIDPGTFIAVSGKRHVPPPVVYAINRALVNLIR